MTKRFRKYAVIGLALAVTAVAVPVALARSGDSSDAATETVAAYLEALREGDTDLADTYTAEAAAEPGHGQSTELLTAEALDGDWEVTDLDSRPDGEEAFLVEATIASGESTSAGVFALAPGDDGDLVITNPYVQLWVPSGSPSAFEVNGQRVERESTDGHSNDVWLYLAYPGSYTWFTETPDLYPSELETLLVLPADELSNTRVETIMQETFELPAELAAEADLLLTELIDECAAGTEIRPEACPFNAATDDPLSDDATVEIDWGEYVHEGEVAWEVVSYPEVVWWYTSGSIKPVETAPGYVELTVRAREVYSDDDFGDLRVRCGIDLEAIWGRLGEAGGLDIGATTGWSTCDRIVED